MRLIDADALIDSLKGKTVVDLETIKNAPTITARTGQMYECFNCLHDSVIWDSDFMYEEFGLEGEGIVHCCHCVHCGAEITYYVPIEGESEDE